MSDDKYYRTLELPPCPARELCEAHRERSIPLHTRWPLEVRKRVARYFLLGSADDLAVHVTAKASSGDTFGATTLNDEANCLRELAALLVPESEGT